MILAATPAVSAAQPRLHWAEAVGSRVPRGECGGRIEAVFESACIVLLDGGRRIALLASRAGNVAHGIRLVQDLRFDQRLRAGMPVQLAAEGVVVDGGAMAIRLSGARAWSAGLRPGRCDWRPRSCLAAIRARDLLRGEAARRGSEFLACVLRQPATDSPLAGRIATVLPALALASRTGDREAALRECGRLVGLGPGLTPAGDDFLIGWLAGLTLQASAPAQTAFLRAMSDGVAAMACATTFASREHLADACALEFSERLADLALAIGDAAPPAALATRVAMQAGVGASSGADAAAGLLFALFDCSAAAPAG